MKNKSQGLNCAKILNSKYAPKIDPTTIQCHPKKLFWHDPFWIFVLLT